MSHPQVTVTYVPPTDYCNLCPAHRLLWLISVPTDRCHLWHPTDYSSIFLPHRLLPSISHPQITVYSNLSYPTVCYNLYLNQTIVSYDYCCFCKASTTGHYHNLVITTGHLHVCIATGASACSSSKSFPDLTLWIATCIWDPLMDSDIRRNADIVHAFYMCNYICVGLLQTDQRKPERWD